MFGKQKNLVKTYKGSQVAAQKAFLREAEKLAQKGYVPVSEKWGQGSWGLGDFILALILCFVLIGFIIFIYMLIVKPAGTLTVTYQLKQESPAKEVDEKVCPTCAETIKMAAVKCRYCGHEFQNA
jgi:ribosomal protein L40E